MAERSEEGAGLSAPKVLVVRFAAIGDCIMAAWAVSAIRQGFPDATITWAVQSRSVPIIDRTRLVNHVCEFEREKWKSRRWSPATWRQQVLKYTELRKERFDVGFDFHGHSKTALCLRLASPKRRFAARATDIFARSLLHPLVETKPTCPHEVAFNLALVRAWEPLEDVSLPLMPGLLSPIKSSERPLATIQTGGSDQRRLYPAEQWSTVATGLAAAGFHVVAIGGPGDPRLPGSPCEQRVGEWSLRESLGAVAGSAVHLAADTGTAHAASAYGVPVVGVFGPTDPARSRPWGAGVRVLRAESRLPGDVRPDEIVSAALEIAKERRTCAS